MGKARGGGGTAPGGRRVAVAVAPSRSPSVGSGPRALRTGVGVPGLVPPSTPKLEGAKVSRAGSRVSAGAGEATAGGEVGGIVAVACNGAVPVVAGARGGTPAGPGFDALPRIGGGGGPDLPVGFVAAEVAASLESAAALTGLVAGCDGGLGDSVTDDSARNGQYATADGSARYEHYKEISDDG